MWMPFGVCCGLVVKLGFFYWTPYFRAVGAQKPDDLADARTEMADGACTNN